jgi:hypothetical protein
VGVGVGVGLDDPPHAASARLNTQATLPNTNLMLSLPSNQYVAATTWPPAIRGASERRIARTDQSPVRIRSTSCFTVGVKLFE